MGQTAIKSKAALKQSLLRLLCILGGILVVAIVVPFVGIVWIDGWKGAHDFLANDWLEMSFEIVGSLFLLLGIMVAFEMGKLSLQSLAERWEMLRKLERKRRLKLGIAIVAYFYCISFVIPIIGLLITYCYFWYAYGRQDSHIAFLIDWGTPRLIGAVSILFFAPYLIVPILTLKPVEKLVAWFERHPTALRIAKAALEETDILKFEEPEPDEGERVLLAVGRACVRDAALNDDVKTMLECVLDRSDLDPKDTVVVKRTVERLSIRLRQSALPPQETRQTTEKAETNNALQAE